MKLTLLFISLFILNSHRARAADCVFVIMGGKKEWVSLLPGLSTDISIDVDAAVKKEAARSGCKIITTANDTEKDFLEKFKELKKSRAGTTFHLAFTDHGAPPGPKINDSVLITGSGEYTTYGKFLAALKENIPKGSHVTFQTNNCWPNMSEALIANNTESHFQMCGGSSTSSEQMSWNLHRVYADDDGSLVGPYGALGLRFVNDYKKKYGKNPSLQEFHYHAKKGDLGNIKRQPGLTTSISFAQSVAKKKSKNPILKTDVDDLLLAINWKNDTALENFLHTPRKSLEQLTENAMTGNCKTYSKDPFGQFLKVIAPLHDNLVDTNFLNLPAPLASQSIAAQKWMKQNQKKLAVLLTKIAIEKAEFINKNKHHPKEKYKNIEELWNELKEKHTRSLRDYEFNLRILQEGKVTQNFLNVATPEEKNRFQNFLNCENKPIY